MQYDHDATSALGPDPRVCGPRKDVHQPVGDAGARPAGRSGKGPFLVRGRAPFPYFHGAPSVCCSDHRTRSRGLRRVSGSSASVRGGGRGAGLRQWPAAMRWCCCAAAADGGPGLGPARCRRQHPEPLAGHRSHHRAAAAPQRRRHRLPRGDRTAGLLRRAVPRRRHTGTAAPRGAERTWGRPCWGCHTWTASRSRLDPPWRTW